MSRYKIYDNKSPVFTPIGEELTAEQWLSRYPWAKHTKMVVGGGVINGSVALVFDDYVSMMAKAGCDFSACASDQDYLDAIENFEDSASKGPTENTVSDQARIADALEDIVALNMPVSE